MAGSAPNPLKGAFESGDLRSPLQGDRGGKEFWRSAHRRSLTLYTLERRHCRPFNTKGLYL